MISRDEEVDGRSTDRLATSEEHEPVGVPMPLRPTPPLAKRLNRNALTVAAALAGITVITVLVVTRPSRSGASEGAPPSGEAPAPVPAHPAFLDQPPKPLPLPNSDTDRGEITAGQGARGAQLPVPPPLGETTSVLPVPGSIASGAHDGPPVGPSPRYEAYQSALTSGVLVGERDDRRTHAAAPSATDADPLAGMSAGLAVTPRLMLAPPVAGSAAGGAESHGPPTGWSSAVATPGPTSCGPYPYPTPTATLTSLAAPMPPTVLRLDSAGSPYTIRAGTVVAGFLVTGINSDLPGEVLGRTRSNVFDSETQHNLLVPKGSRLIGTYDSRSVGTGRLIVAWTRLILPDGRSMTLPRLAGTDMEGQAGLHDEVEITTTDACTALPF